MRDPATPLRLLYVQPARSFGGAERQASLVLSRLPEEGIEPTVLVGPGRDVLPWFAEAGVASVAHSQHFPRERFRFALLPAECAALAQLLDDAETLRTDHAFDVVAGSLGFGWAASGLLGRRWHVPAVWRAGGLSSGEVPDRVEALAARSLARLLRPALLVANARAVIDHWGPIVGLPTALVPNAVELAPGERAEREGGRGAFVVGFLGRLAPEKGLPELVRAVARLRARGVDARLVVGGPGDAAAVQRLVDEAGLKPHAQVTGPVRDVAAFLEGCDAVVSSSRSEGSPNVLLEAMALGRPVVATAVGGTPELVRHEVDGLLVPPGAPEAMASALERVARDEALRRRLGAAGRARAHGFSAAASARALATVLRAVVAGAAAARVEAPGITPRA
jgi:glycosyltransferase involved in cell wall biosynthesis